MKHAPQHFDEEQLWEYLDGELPATQRDELRTHLHECPVCHKLFQEVCFFEANISKAIADTPSPNFVQAVMHQIEIEVKACEYQPLLRSFWRRLAVASFAAMLFAAVGVAVLFPGTGQLPFQLEMHNLISLADRLMMPLHRPMPTFLLIIVSAFWGLFLLDKFLISKVLQRKS